METKTKKTSSPIEELKNLAEKFKLDIFTEDFAKRMDQEDPLKSFRNKFYIPILKDIPDVDKDLVDLEETCIYMSGNSLGLKPKSADKYMKNCLKDWEKLGVLSHFNGDLPAAYCDLPGLPAMAKILGAKPQEVALMNGLTVNLHLLLVSFYHPTAKRHKILMEANAFPSDRYAMKSQIRFHGFTPEKSLIQLSPREGEYYLRTEDILDVIEKEGDSIAVVMFSGVQYYTGQKFAMKAITDAGHAKGCFVGFDLAHAVGNVKLHLNEWGVDFACFCSYKYLNAGSGAMAGAFIHEKHNAKEMPALHGWWSNIKETRFEMKEDPDLDLGVAALRLSNPPPWLACLLLASLEMFEETSMDEITSKQFLLTGYLEFLLIHYFGKKSGCKNPVVILTPSDPEQRGTHLSVMFTGNTLNLHKEIIKRGVVCDVRGQVIRLAPVPLYISFHDVYKLIDVLKQILLP